MLVDGAYKEIKESDTFNVYETKDCDTGYKIQLEKKSVNSLCELDVYEYILYYHFGVNR